VDLASTRLFFRERSREAGAVVAVAIGAAIVFALVAAARGPLAYLALLIAPGLVVLLAWGKESSRQARSFPEAAVLAQVFGGTILLGVAWGLALAGAFSLLAVTLGVLVATATIGVVRRHQVAEWRLKDLARDAGGRWFTILLVAVAALLAVPVLWAQSNGTLIGGDTATFSRVAAVLTSLHAWPTVAQAGLLSTPPGSIAPGISIVYALLAQSMNVNPIYVANGVSIAVIAFGGLGMQMLVARFTDLRSLRYGLAMLWMLSYPFTSPLVIEILPGYSPDTTFGIPFLFVGLAYLVDVIREGPARAPTDVVSGAVVLGIASTAIALLSPLIWLIWALALGWSFLVLLRRDWRGSVEMILPAMVVAVLVFLTIFSLSAILASSDVTSGGPVNHMVQQTSASQLLNGLLAAGGPALIVTGVGGALWLLSAWRKWAPGYPPPRLWWWLALLALTLGGLALTEAGALLLGIGQDRYLPYFLLALIPFVVVGLSRLVHWAERGRILRIVARGTPIYVAASVLVAGFVVAPSVQHIVTPGASFGPNELAAAQWLAANGHGTIVADANGGAQCVDLLQNFVTARVVVRDEFALYADLYLTPSPYNLSSYYANAVLTNPTAANALQAQTAYNFTYYYLVRAYDSAETTAFARLAYFPLVYSNAAVDVFLFDRGRVNQSFFLPAVDYVAATGGTQTAYDASALNSPVSLPQPQNVVDCPGSNPICPDANTSTAMAASVTYSVNITQAALYTLVVHQHVVSPGVWSIGVELNGTTVGSVILSQEGWQFSSPISFEMGAGSYRVSLTFRAALAAFMPIDYLILAQ
jgi:hypothetical protein